MIETQFSHDLRAADLLLIPLSQRATGLGIKAAMSATSLIAAKDTVPAKILGIPTVFSGPRSKAAAMATRRAIIRGALAMVLR